MGARKHTCDVDMRQAYAIRVLDSIEDTLKVHMYWLNVQGLRVKAVVVCCIGAPFVTFGGPLGRLWALGRH